MRFFSKISQNIRQRSDMGKTIDNRVQAYIRNKVKDTRRNLLVDYWKTAPHEEFKNPAERSYQTIQCSSRFFL